MSTMRQLAALWAIAVFFLSAGAAGAARAGASPDFTRGKEIDPDFNLGLRVKPPASGSLDLWIGTAEASTLVRFETAAVSIEPRGKSGPADPVRASITATPEGSYECLVKHRSGPGACVALVANGRELGRLPAAAPAGKAAPRMTFTGGGSAEILRYQKIDRSEPVLLTDDFTRQGVALAPWSPDHPDRWGIRVDPNPDTSASPFAMECAAGGGPTLLRAGQDFWDDYVASAAVRAEASPAAAGLAVSLNGGFGFLLRLRLEGTGSGGAGAAELVRMSPDGKDEVLASRPLAGSPGAWYLLRLAFRAGCLRAWVDGTELAALSGRADLCGGQVGLWSSGVATVRFDDVRVEALDIPPADFARGGATLQLALRDWLTPPAALPDYFRNDHTMSGWARLTDDFRPAGSGYWHRSRLSGSQEISWCRPGRPLQRGQLVLGLCAEGNDFSSGYRLVADLGADASTAVLSVFERGRRAGGAVVELAGAGIERLSFSREAGLLVARTGSRIAVTAPDTLGLPGGAAGATALGGWRLQAAELRASAGSLLDEVFSRAPVEWLALTGSWDISSRWACDPEFTWMLGRQRRGVARIDLKRGIPAGDFAMDIHFAVGMAERPGPFYDSPVSLSAALCDDPTNPADGFVLAFGGPDEPSRILRAGEVLASGDGLLREDPRNTGDTSELHSHWFHLVITRTGRRLALEADGHRLCEIEDAGVAGEKRLSLWTRGDNGAVLARVRLDAAAELGPRGSPFLDAQRAPKYAPPDAAWNEFSSRDGGGGAMLCAAEDARALRLVNVNAGGSFAAAWAPPGGIDLAERGWLEFDWRCSPGARFNLYLVRGDRFYRAQLTGPADREGGRFGLVHLGSVPGAGPASHTAPGAFRHFAFDLGAALAAAEPRIEDLRVDEVRIGNYEYEDAALLEGFTGNRSGEWIELSGWRAGGEPGKDRSVRPVLALESAPGELRAGRRTDAHARPDPRTAYVLCAGQRFPYDGAALRYDAFSGTLAFSPRLAGCALKPGANELSFGYNGFRRAAMDSTAACTLDFDPRGDRRPPTLPRLLSPAPLEHETFEPAPKGEGWESFGGADGARLTLDSPGADGGGRCLLGENTRCGGTMGVLARAAPLDVRRYPTLCFDSRIEPRTHVNLILNLSGSTHVQMIVTDDRGGQGATAGTLDGAAPDGRWHHLTADLFGALSRSRRTVVQSMALADMGHGSSTTACAWRVDNWTVLPALNGARPVEFAWEARDESGISGYSAVLDRRQQTEPPARVSTAEGRLRAAGGMADGLWFLHVRACDGAGNWGPTAHWPFRAFAVSDTEAPQVTSVSPADGATLCPEFIEVALADAGAGISPHDVELTAGGRSFRPGDPGVSYFTAENRMRVPLTDSRGRLLLPAGPVKCLLRASDLAGNAMPERSWTWQLRLEDDRAVPAAPRAVCLPSDHLIAEDFENGQSTFCNWRRGAAWRRRARERGEAGGGDWHLRFTGRRPWPSLIEFELWPAAFNANRYPLLAFDYRIGPDSTFGLMPRLGNQHRVLTFAGNSSNWQARIGSLGEAVADGQWHRVEADLRRLKLEGGRSLDHVQRLMALLEGSDIDIDNFVLASPFGRDPEFFWDAPAAASGILGYSWLLDGSASTEPPETVTGAEPRAKFDGLDPGTHWFHVRAKSGSGVWGKTAHTRFVIEKPE